MAKNRIITLLTDFGLTDVYVGVMKGAIACINSQLQVIDLTHDIPPQDVAAARFCLLSAYAYFPRNTVHVAVVDPGVGSKRRAIAVEFSGGFLVGPDNGLFGGVLEQAPAIAAVELNNSQYWRSSNPSFTFHGRDIFAPIGAHLAIGVALKQLGTEIDTDSLVQLSLPKLTVGDRHIIGCIQYIDRFGNLVTNIPGDLVSQKSWSATIGNKIVKGGNTYSEVSVGKSIALIGSHGWVEIAVNQGNAHQILQSELGGQVTLKTTDN